MKRKEKENKQTNKHMGQSLHGGGDLIWIGRDVPQPAQDPAQDPCLCYFSKNDYPRLGIFWKKSTHFLRFCHKTPNFQGFIEIFKIRPKDIFFLNGTHVQGFFARKSISLRHIPVCRNMWIPPGVNIFKCYNICYSRPIL